MNKTSSQSKAHVVPVAVVAGLGMAGMGLVSSGVVAADTTSVTDTISITVQPSCTFNSVEDKTYIGSAANGTEVGNFNDSGVHEFNLFCNDNNGFIVTATPYDLEASGIEDAIAYTDNYNPSGVNSIWSAAIASEATGVTVVPVVPIGGGTILSSDTSTATAGVDFSATYSAYVGTATPAGTYSGTIVYTLTAAGTSNSNSGNSGDNGNGGGESSNEVTDNTQNDNGGSGTGTSGGTSIGGDSSNTSSNSTPSNTPKASPANLNNTYNTYNTTNYVNGGGAGTAGTTGTQLAMNNGTSDVTDGAMSEDDDESNGNSKVSGSYEKPLGVTESTSSDEESGIDWMPIVAVGAAVAVAGAAAVALAKSEKEEE